MRFRKIVSGLAVAGAALVLVACGEASSPTAAPASKSTQAATTPTPTTEPISRVPSNAGTAAANNRRFSWGPRDALERNPKGIKKYSVRLPFINCGELEH